MFKSLLIIFIATFASLRAFALVGADPYFHKQTALQYMHLESASAIFLDHQTTLHAPILIGVIDEGQVNAHHPDMTGVLLPESDTTTHSYDAGHGQYVTGILAALTSNGVGISGAIGTHARVLYKQIRNVNDIVFNINTMAARGVAVINMSLGLKISCRDSDDGKCQIPIATNPLIAEAMEQAMTVHNVVFVTSAGNDYQIIKTLPPAADGLIVVGAMDESENCASYSNHGPGVSLFAPDFGVWGLSFDSYEINKPATSFTTPLVTAGAAWAALYLQAHHVAYTPKEIKSLLLKSVQPQKRLIAKAEAAGSLDYYSLATNLQTLVQSAQPRLQNAGIRHTHKKVSRLTK